MCNSPETFIAFIECTPFSNLDHCAKLQALDLSQKLRTRPQIGGPLPFLPIKCSLGALTCERLLLVTFQTSFYGNFDFLGN